MPKKQPVPVQSVTASRYDRRAVGGSVYDPKNFVTPLDIPEGTLGAFSIKHLNRPAGSQESLASMRTALFQGDRPVVVRFPFATRWHQLVEEDQGVWTTDLPIERVQQERDVYGFRGDVLCTGLGVGLTPTVLAQRPEVRSVTVIERSPEVIGLVLPHIRRGDAGAKIRVYCDDAFDFLTETTSRFDYVFHDIWQGDGLLTLRETVVPLKRLSRRVLTRRMYDAARVRCWNEGVMLGQLHVQIADRLRGHYIGCPAEFRDLMSPPRRSLIDNPSLCLTANYWRWWYDAQPSRVGAYVAAKDYCKRSFGSSAWEKRWGKLQHCDRREEAVEEEDEHGAD